LFVIGTAGHVDHGKSTLVKALTGIDPDRLREEKERQMTIDLGFAWLTTPSEKEVGIVDVPGHRDFIDNMLAGAGGIDAVLFIIAADEGIMPQSREHLSILELLEIKQGLIVLTKTDLVPDEEWLDLIKTDIRRFATGTFLEESPIIEVSSVTGKGIDGLLDSIDVMLKNCEPKQDNHRPRLPVDRVFTLRGFGTIVTGTLLDGQFSVGQQVEILPQKIQTRIRGIQSHKKKLEVANAGSRTALNLTGLDVSEIFRGNVVVQIGAYSPTRRIDVRLTMLKDTKTALKHDDIVKFYCGTNQTSARVRVIGKDAILPGEKGFLQLELIDAIVVVKGDHYILRKPSPGETLGGGVILDENPGKRIKRFSKHSLDHFQLLEVGTTQEIIFANLQKNNPLTLLSLSEKTGISIEKLKNEIIGSSEFEILEIQKEKLLTSSFVTTKAIWQKLTDTILNYVKTFHKKYPLRQGISKDALRRLVDLQPKLFGICVDLFVHTGILSAQGEVIFISGHKPEFDQDTKKSAAKILSRFEKTPYSPPPISELINEFDAEIIQALINNGDLIQTSEDIAFKKQDYDLMLCELIKYFKVNKEVALNQVRDMFQTSRKYALSFLEYLDKKGITVREGDKRIFHGIDKV
jgi:selenocysteine-specific elongation factor